jgi:archaellum component FlaC
MCAKEKNIFQIFDTIDDEIEKTKELIGDIKIATAETYASIERLETLIKSTGVKNEIHDHHQS